MKTLNVFYETELVGVLSEDNEERLSFKYSKEWLGNPNSFPLSIALKLNDVEFGHLPTKAFFENLLPEGSVKESLEAHSNTNIKGEFDFLKNYGEDCAGAFVITADKEVPIRPNQNLKKEIELETLYGYLNQNKSLADAIVNNEGGHFSLAGAQDKIPVIIEDTKLFIPLGNIPTTDIIKPHVRYFNSTKDSPYNEYFCMRLAKAVGLNVPEVDIIEGEYPLYIIRRFDRIEVNGVTKRIHQQDFCQARGIMSSKKYESDGGPTFASNYNLVKDTSVAPIPDLNQLLMWLWFNLAIGNNDCHSKNLAFIQTPQGLRLSPFYDLLSTSIYKEISPRFSYGIGKQMLWYKLSKKNFAMQTKEIGISETALKNIASKLLKKIDLHLDTSVHEFDSRFSNLKTAKIIEKEIKKRMKYFRDKFSLE
jgi:serine/threonine-protein kinase HipA